MLRETVKNAGCISCEGGTGLKKKLIQVAVVLVMIVLIIAGAGINMLIERYKPTTERQDLYTYFNIEESNTEDVILYLQGEDLLPVRTEYMVKLLDGKLYLPYDMVIEECNARFYWDESVQMMVFTTAYDVYKYPLNSKSYTVNGTEESYDCIIVKKIGDSLYMSLDYVKEKSDIKYDYYTEPARLMLYNQWGEVTYRKAAEAGAIRVLGGIKSEILADVEEGEELIVRYEMEEWACVQNLQGVQGFIEKKVLGDNVQVTLENPDYEEPEYPSLAYEREEKVNMAWHQIGGTCDGSTLASAMEGVSGVNVVSPTWFFMSDNDGNLMSLASYDYVSRAHSMGLEVWGLVENMSYDISTYEILSRMESREHLVDELIRYALEYDLDGINVDIESLSFDAEEAYIQFIRELSIECRANQLVLSIDNYVPTASSDHYNRKEQGIVADYVVIMGYDEHYAGMSEAGSTASIGFVQTGIENTLKEVPKEKVINAIPFYTRVFKQIPESAATDEQKQSLPLVEDNTSEYGRYLLDSIAVSMAQAEKLLANNNVTPVWNEALGQYYGEYVSGGCKYLVWLEDSASIGLKVDLIREYELAGVAEWSLNLAKSTIWETVSQHLE